MLEQSAPRPKLSSVTFFYNWSILLAIVAGCLLQIPSAKAGEYAQIVGLGMHFYTGPATDSLTGSNGYSLTFGSERNKGVLRPSLGAVLQYSSGTGYLAWTASNYTLYGADFLAGFKTFAIQDGSI